MVNPGGLPGHGAQRQPILPPALLAELPTPCLLVDLRAADRNISAAARLLRGTRVSLRPHFKAHKCTQLLRRQLQAEGCFGATCQTAGEAECLSEAGFADILVANVIADQSSLAQLGRAAQSARITVAADCLAHVNLLQQAAAATDVTFDVLVELDVGLGRCGLPLGSPDLVPLAAVIGRAPRLTFRGIQAYAGHAVLREGRELRRTLSQQVELHVAAELDRLTRAGLSCPVVTGGGTGTLQILGESEVFTEAQAGSYVLLDAAYHQLGLPFEPALFCVTTVISCREGETAVTDAGLKALSADHGLPIAVNNDARVLRLSDEHALLAIAADSNIAVGDKVILIPSHVDPTVNLHDMLHVFDGEQLARWPVDGRRVTRLRTQESRP